MKRWWVVTPEYGVVDPILDDGTGPMEYGADCIKIEAETARDAIAFGVKLMLNNPWKPKGWVKYKWCKDARSDGVSPYSGVKAFPVEEEPDWFPNEGDRQYWHEKNGHER